MLSEAPADICGSTATPGQIVWTTASTWAISAGVSAVSGLGMPPGRAVSFSDGSATAPASARCTASGDSPGIARHWMVARARCGSAFCAWPPSIMVAVQVLRSRMFVSTLADRRARAALAGLGCTTASMSACTVPLSSRARRRKYPVVVPVRCTEHPADNGQLRHLRVHELQQSFHAPSLTFAVPPVALGANSRTISKALSVSHAALPKGQKSSTLSPAHSPPLFGLESKYRLGGFSGGQIG